MSGRRKGGIPGSRRRKNNRKLPDIPVGGFRCQHRGCEGLAPTTNRGHFHRHLAEHAAQRVCPGCDRVFDEEGLLNHLLAHRCPGVPDPSPSTSRSPSPHGSPYGGPNFGAGGPPPQGGAGVVA